MAAAVVAVAVMLSHTVASAAPGAVAPGIASPDDAASGAAAPEPASAATAAAGPTAAPATESAPSAAERPAPAPSAPMVVGDDEVALADGSVVRGTVIEEVKASHVTVLVLGETRRIEWSQVAAITRGKYAPAAAPAASAAALPLAGSIRVQVTGKETDFNMITGHSYATAVGTGGSASAAGVAWSTVCSGNCETRVDPNGEYVVGRSALTFSRRLKLADVGEDVEIHVKRKGSGLLIGLGAIGLGFGLGMLIGGPVVLAADAVDNSAAVGTGLIVGGVGLTALGSVSLAFGRAKAEIRPLALRRPIPAG